MPLTIHLFNSACTGHATDSCSSNDWFLLLEALLASAADALSKGSPCALVPEAVVVQWPPLFFSVNPIATIFLSTSYKCKPLAALIDKSAL